MATDVSSSSGLPNPNPDASHDDNYDPVRTDMRSYFIGSPSLRKHMPVESEVSRH